MGQLESPEQGATTHGLRTSLVLRLGFGGGCCRSRVDRHFGERRQRQRRYVGKGGSAGRFWIGGHLKSPIGDQEIPRL